MKRIITRILTIITIIIIGYQNFCYADVYIPHAGTYMNDFDVLITIVGIAIIAVFGISFFIVKIIKKAKEDKKGIKVALGLLKLGFCFVVTIFSIWWHFCELNTYYYTFYSWRFDQFMFDNISIGTIILLLVPLIMYIVSGAFVLLNKKKIAKIIWGLTLAFIIITSIIIIVPVKSVEYYNHRFTKFEEEDTGWTHITLDVQGLVNAAIENNKFGRKTTIKYNGIEYKTPVELKVLLRELDENSSYEMHEKYHRDNHSSYIEMITLELYVDPSFSQIVQYIGELIDGSTVKSVIENVVNIVDITVEPSGKARVENTKNIVAVPVRALKYIIQKEVTFAYYDGAGNEIQVGVNTSNVDSVLESESYSKLYNSIESDKMYKIGIKTYGYTYSLITITRMD